jgi:hypothetical protein
MSIQVEELEDDLRAVIVNCDDGRSARCRRVYETRMRFTARGADARWAVVTQAREQGWQRLRHAGVLIDLCPVCTDTPLA